MNISNYKVSIILPYFNEEKNLEYTFHLLQNQTHKPDEIIFVDSNSSDNSHTKLELLIQNQNLQNINIYNFKTNLKSPSECKNFGIKKSNFDWILFMDFELKFKNEWIENQLIHQLKSNTKVNFGVAYITGKKLFDRSCIFQTFGYKSNTPIIPSSLVHKSIFYEYGDFLPIRSTYDRVWISKIRSHENLYSINYNIKIDYLNYAYARGPFELFLKTVNLCLQSLFLKNYNTPYIYIFIIILLLYFNNIFFYFSLLSINFFLRGIYLPYKKNKKYFLKNLNLLPYHVLTGVIIDIARFIGFSIGLLFRLIGFKFRLDRLIRK